MNKQTVKHNFQLFGFLGKDIISLRYLLLILYTTSFLEKMNNTNYQAKLIILRVFCKMSQILLFSLVYTDNSSLHKATTDEIPTVRHFLLPVTFSVRTVLVKAGALNFPYFL